MHANSAEVARQHRIVERHAHTSDAYSFFNLLTSPKLYEQVESLLPAHRERLFPPTETPSIFLAQALRADRSCQNAANAAALRRLAGGLNARRSTAGASFRASERLPARLARKLLVLADAYGEPAGARATRIDFPITQQELGKMTGVSRESINKLLRGWQDRGLVALGRGRVTILDQDRLRRLVDPT